MQKLVDVYECKPASVMAVVFQAHIIRWYLRVSHRHSHGDGHDTRTYERLQNFIVAVVEGSVAFECAFEGE